MVTVVRLLAVLLTVALLGGVAQNASVWVPLTLGQTAVLVALPALVGAGLVGGALGLTALFWPQMQHVRQQLRQIDRQRERQMISAEAATDRVNALEQQVKTLEAALDRALQGRA